MNGKPRARGKRFVVRLAAGRTLLVSHNVDLASRVPVETGDAVTVRGQYEWNEQGGMVHWTHDDPNGRHSAGWVRHAGRSYN